MKTYYFVVQKNRWSPLIPPVELTSRIQGEQAETGACGCSSFIGIFGLGRYGAGDDVMIHAQGVRGGEASGRMSFEMFRSCLGTGATRGVVNHSGAGMLAIGGADCWRSKNRTDDSLTGFDRLIPRIVGNRAGGTG